MVWALRIMAAFALVLALAPAPAGAAQRSPAWWDPDGVGTGSDWHYRVPVTLPSTSSVNSTAKVDIDFSALLTQLGVSGSFDANSVRVVRPGGTIATTQEFNDTVYAGATDASGNARGEVRWIVEDGGTQTYYIYFDVTQNGAKSANPQTPIDGNFEHSSTGTAQPPGWNAPSRATTDFDAQVRPSETASVTSDISPLDGVNPRTTDGTPYTGAYSYLLGWRSSSATLVSGAPGVTFTRTITVPATNPGSLTVRWKPEGWDAEAYDYLTISVIGSTTSTLVTGSSGAYATAPAAANQGSAQAANLSPGYRQYNGFDCDLRGIHHSGMSVACHSEPWFSATLNLSAFAGQTVTLSFTATQDNADKTWYLIDDIEWSVVAGTLGSAEGFGVAATSPTGSMPPGKTLKVSATVDAKPAAASNPLTADILNASGTAVASAVKLYNDGTHGDATANDASWSNDGSDAANPTYTVPLSSASSSGWTVRVYARDASTSTQGAADNGLVHRNGQPSAAIAANYWSIDEGSFSVDAAVITVAKTMSIVSDGVSGANPKAIPGAVLLYCLTIGNSGTASASSLVAIDSLPAQTSYVTGSVMTGTSCATATTAGGGTVSGQTLTVNKASLASGSSFAVTYQVTLQ